MCTAVSRAGQSRHLSRGWAGLGETIARPSPPVPPIPAVPTESLPTLSPLPFLVTLTGPGPAAGGPAARAPGLGPAEGFRLREAAVCAGGRHGHRQAHEAPPGGHDRRGVGPLRFGSCGTCSGPGQGGCSHSAFRNPSWGLLRVNWMPARAKHFMLSSRQPIFQLGKLRLGALVSPVLVRV